MAELRHLERLAFAWGKQPVYFITTCVAGREPVLATETAADILVDEWRGLRERHGWAVGHYVIMPDHVHFFITAELDCRKPLSAVIGKWKEWSAKRVLRQQKSSGQLWQAEFFDHLLRSDESRAEKWAYVRENPVRAGLVTQAKDWPFSGWIDFE